MDHEWRHFDIEQPNIGENVICYDSISDCLSIGRLIDENTLETMYIDNIEADSQMEFWKPFTKPPQKLLESYEER